MKVVTIFCTFCAVVFYFASVDIWKTASPESLSVAEALSSNNIDGFARADKLREFKFPQDDGPHRDFQTEWWYYTGNLVTKNNRRFGYQFTIFRRSTTPKSAKRMSPWATNQIYFAHFAVSDVQNNVFWHEERFSRGAVGLAGALENGERVWIENWSIVRDNEQVNVHAFTDKYAIDLDITPLKSRVLNGNRGLSQKSDAKGNASYYYSQTRLQTTGKITIEGEEFTVVGLSWLDREWSTSVLGKDQLGWDWFSLQLNDGCEIMLYQLRKKNGGVDTNSSGTFIAKDGSYYSLKNSDFEIKVIRHWVSETSQIRYPAKWEVSIPKEDIVLYVEPYQANQEWVSGFTYWEGAVKVSGKSIRGDGYVEMTGYKKR